MKKGLKIIAILTFLLSLGVLYLGSKLMTEVIAKRKEVKNLDAQVKTLEDEKSQLTDRVNSLTQANEGLKRDISSLRSERDRIASNLREEKSKVNALNREMANLRSEKDSLQSKVNSIQREMNDLNQKLATLQEKEAHWKDTAKKELKRREILEKELAQYKGIPGGKEEEKVKLVPEIERKVSGKVLDFKYPGIIAIKFDKGILLRPGVTLYAFRKSKVIGKVVVKEVYSTLIVAKVKSMSLGETVSPNDILKIAKWVPEKEGGK